LHLKRGNRMAGRIHQRWRRSGGGLPVVDSRLDSLRAPATSEGAGLPATVRCVARQGGAEVVALIAIRRHAMSAMPAAMPA